MRPASICLECPVVRVTAIMDGIWEEEEEAASGQKIGSEARRGENISDLLVTHARGV